MIKEVLKRDGLIEAYDPNKLNDWGIWGTSQFNINWIPIVQATERILNAIADENDGKVTSKQIHDTVINQCLGLETYEGYMMAGKFYGASLPREIYGTKRHPSIKSVHQKLIDDKLMRPTNYTDEEYEYLENVIEHKLDLVTIHYSLEFIRKKYSLKNWVTGKEYETPQFTLMRMAMALCDEDEPVKRLELVEAFYENFSGKGDYVGYIPNKKLSAPSPNYTNLGTYSKAFASCCLYAIGDSIPSLSAGNLIAHEMTAASAGLGLSLRTRSINDPVRNGAIQHLGKKPYIDAQGKMAVANKQGSRGGAMTLYFPIVDPEVDLLTYLRNPKTPTASRNRDVHYCWVDNTFIAKKVAKNESVFLFNDYTAPKLMELYYSSDTKAFEEEYNRLEKDPTFKKTYRNAREIVLNAYAEGFHTGTMYYMNATESNRHTPFKEAIDSSNLCVAPETNVLTREYGNTNIATIVNQMVNVWNGEEWSKVLIEKTGVNQKLVSVLFDDGSIVDTTTYHKWHIQQTNEVVEKRTHELQVGDTLVGCDLPLLPHGTKWLVNAYETGYENPSDNIPDITYTTSSRLKWLAGLIDSKGVYSNREDIKIVDSNRDFLFKIKLLLTELGISSRILKCDGNVEYSYLLIKRVQVNKLIELGINTRKHLLQEYHKPQSESDLHIVKVLGVIDYGRVDDTYCLNEPKKHRVIFNSVISSQCLEINQPKKPYSHPKYLYDGSDHGEGEISTCNLAAINVSFLDLTPENDEKYREVAYLALKMIDKTIQLSQFPFEHLNFTSRQRMNAAVGLMGVATLMARNGVTYDTPEGLEFADKMAERHMYFLIEASLRISKERGLAPWIHKTKWPEGWLPIDTYNKNVDELVPLTLRYPWEELRQRIIDNGGIAHSCLNALMPGESSSKGLGAANAYYPVREPVMVKTDGIVTSRWAVYMEEGLEYQSAWDISMSDMVKYTAVLQKWTDQSISYDQHRPIGKAEKVPSTEVLETYLSMHKYGIKTRYYVNTNTHTDNSEEAKLNVNTGISLNESNDDDMNDFDPSEICESCSL